jgi:hypothetical protein
VNSTEPILHFIDDLKNNLYCDDKLICDVLKLTSTELERVKLTKDMKFDSIINLCNFYELSLEQILKKEVDFNLLRKKIITPSTAIPSKYLNHPGTYMENIRSIINYVKNSMSENTANNLMDRFQISKQAILNDKLNVNVSMAEDVVKFVMEELNFNSHDIFNMAISSYSSDKRKAIMKFGEIAKTDKEVVEIIAKNSTQYEKNFDYHVETIDDTRFILKSVSREEAHDLTSQKELTSQYLIYYKKAAIEVITALMGRPPLKIIDSVSELKNGRQHINYYFKDTN